MMALSGSCNRRRRPEASASPPGCEDRKRPPPADAEAACPQAVPGAQGREGLPGRAGPAPQRADGPLGRRSPRVVREVRVAGAVRLAVAGLERDMTLKESDLLDLLPAPEHVSEVPRYTVSEMIE